MNNKTSSSFTRWLIAVLAFLFAVTLGVMMLSPFLLGEEGVSVWMVLLNGLILAIPIGLLYALLGVIILTARQQVSKEQISPRLAKAVYWSPRISGILIVVFMSLFALDAFEAGYSLGEKLFAFFMHMLPMLALAAVLAIAWRWPWVGAAIFGLAALAFSFTIFTGGLMGLGRFLTIGGPLLVIALLFAVNGRWRKEIDLARRPAAPTA